MSRLSAAILGLLVIAAIAPSSVEAARTLDLNGNRAKKLLELELGRASRVLSEDIPTFGPSPAPSSYTAAPVPAYGFGPCYGYNGYSGYSYSGYSSYGYGYNGYGYAGYYGYGYHGLCNSYAQG